MALQVGKVEEAAAVEVETTPREPAIRPVRYILVFALTSILASASIVTLNIVADPYDDFAPDLTTPLSANVAKIKLAQFDALPDTPGVIILGSSRVYQLAPADVEALAGAEAFNFGLPDAHLADVDAVLAWLIATDRVPREVVIGLDVERLQGPSRANVDLRDSPALGRFTGEPTSDVDKARRVLGSFKGAYVADSLKVVRYSLGGYPPERVFFEERGLVITARDLDVAEDIRSAASELRERYANYGPIAPSELERLERLVDRARDAGIVVHLFVTPIHPGFAEALGGVPFANQQEASYRALLSLCAEDVRVHATHDIALFGGVPDEFYDAVHMTRANHARLAAVVFGGAGCSAP